MARCKDGTLYTGIARDVDARIAAHDAGRGAARATRAVAGRSSCARSVDARRKGKLFDSNTP